MITKNVKSIALNIVIFFSIQLAFSEEALYPKKKPVLSSDILDKKISKNVLIPQKKPSKIEEKKIIDDDSLKKKKISKINGVIIPKNKPLIVRKQTSRIAKISKYYSDRDFAYAKQAIQFMEKSNWKDAKKVAKKARAKSIYNFIQWKHLLTTGNRASFYEYKEFLQKT